MREKIELFKTRILNEIIETDFDDKKRGSPLYVKMTKVQYLRCLFKLLKELEK